MWRDSCACPNHRCHPGESRDPWAAAASRGVRWTPAFAGVTLLFEVARCSKFAQRHQPLPALPLPRCPLSNFGEASPPRARRGTPMTNPYETGLDKNPANHQPLSPLSFLKRAAEVYPEKLAVVHGSLRRDYAALCPLPEARLGACRTRHRARGHRGGDRAEHSRNAGTALRAGDDRRRRQHHQHAARRRRHRLHARSRGSEGAVRRPGSSRGWRRTPGACEGQAVRHRHRRCVLRRAGREDRRDGLRELHRQGRPAFQLAVAGRRVAGDRPELYLGHDRQPKGVVYHHRGAICALGNANSGSRDRKRLSVDTADVPLQRLVLPLDHRRRRPARMSASGA